MRLANELKVGIAIIVAAVVFFIGIRFFSSLPLFRGTYELATAFEDAGGLMRGNAVRINGIAAGSITRVRLDPTTQMVQVGFKVDRDIVIPEGSFARVGGFAALGSVDMEVVLGPPGNPPLRPGSVIPGESTPDLMSLVSERAPMLTSRLDSVLVAAGATFEQTQYLLGNTNSRLNRALVELENVATSLNKLLSAEQARISTVLTNFESLSSDLDRFTSENSDSLALAVQNLNRLLRRVDGDLDTLESTAASLDTLLVQLRHGDGTAAKLLNDPALYTRLDSMTTTLNRILTDFESNPGRYLREMKLIEIF